MIISDATPDVLVIDMYERSKYGFRSLATVVQRKDNGEALVGAEVLTGAGFMIEPFWETTEDIEGRCYTPYITRHPDFELSVREGAFDRLQQAVDRLPDHWGIVVKAGFRPYEVQVAVLNAFIRESRTRHVGWSDEQHLEHARVFVSDPRVVCPPHVTGGAIDIDVRDKRTGAYIDMGCPPNTDSEISFLHSDLVTSEQHENRMVLLRAMLTAGFAPNPHEWWHYQYGETYWAAFYGYEATLYDVLMHESV